VTSVHPGGVATSIARSAEVDAMPVNYKERRDLDERFDRAAITTAERAAEIILDGAARGKKRIVVGRDAKIVSFVQRLFPETYASKLAWFLPKDVG